MPQQDIKNVTVGHRSVWVAALPAANNVEISVVIDEKLTLAIGNIRQILFADIPEGSSSSYNSLPYAMKCEDSHVSDFFTGNDGLSQIL